MNAAGIDTRQVDINNWTRELARIRQKYGCDTCRHADPQHIKDDEGCCGNPDGPLFRDGVCGNREGKLGRPFGVAKRNAAKK